MEIVHEVRISRSWKRRHAFLFLALFAATACGSTGDGSAQNTASEIHAAATAASVQSLSVSPSAPSKGQSVTAKATLHASTSTTLQAVTVAVRDAAGNNYDFPDQFNVAVGPTAKTLTFSQSFSNAGTYTYFVAYEQNGTWANLSPQQSFTVGSSGGGDGGTGPGGSNPNGPGGTWNLTFDDEFDGNAYDTSKWADNSSAESDDGHGNQHNGQLEWNQGQNCTVSGGLLTMTAKRESYTSSSGTHYDWTSCLLTTTPSYSFQFGYIEERAKLPAPRGFWPAFWTWQAAGVNSWQETDVYEFYSDNHNILYLTAHAGSGGGVQYNPPFDPSADFHTYGADIEADGVTWYIDGVNAGHASGAPSGATNIITNLAVFHDVPPDGSTTSVTKQVDYIRAWQH